MKRHILLTIVSTGLLLFCSGCSALLLYSASQGDNTPYHIAVGSDRDWIEIHLGKPVTVTPLPDGGQAAIYEHRLPVPEARSAAEKAVKMWISPGHALLLEPFFFPYAVYTAATAPKGKVTFTYSPDGRLLHRDLPPRYGPDEDALGPPTVGEIRERCRSQENVEQSEGLTSDRETEVIGQYEYVECVSLRFAIWGIE